MDSGGMRRKKKRGGLGASVEGKEGLRERSVPAARERANAGGAERGRGFIVCRVRTDVEVEQCCIGQLHLVAVVVVAADEACLRDVEARQPGQAREVDGTGEARVGRGVARLEADAQRHHRRIAGKIEHSHGAAQ